MQLICLTEDGTPKVRVIRSWKGSPITRAGSSGQPTAIKYYFLIFVLLGHQSFLCPLLVHSSEKINNNNNSKTTINTSSELEKSL